MVVREVTSLVDCVVFCCILCWRLRSPQHWATALMNVVPFDFVNDRRKSRIVCRINLMLCKGHGLFDDRLADTTVETDWSVVFSNRFSDTVFQMKIRLERTDGNWLRIDWRASEKSRSFIINWKDEIKRKIWTIKICARKADALFYRSYPMRRTNSLIEYDRIVEIICKKTIIANVWKTLD